MGLVYIKVEYMYMYMYTCMYVCECVHLAGVWVLNWCLLIVLVDMITSNFIMCLIYLAMTVSLWYGLVLLVHPANKVNDLVHGL